MQTMPAVVIGDSPGMLDALATARRVASTTAGVLIQGEHGTGRELLARFLHERSQRRWGPFVSINCSAIAMEAFEAATGGTLFLDDVGDLSAAAQAKVLGVIEERVVEDEASERRAPVDVRVLAATDRDLAQDVAAGRFRADLYYRLAVIVLALPPLRERGDDVRMLAEHFVGSFASANDCHVFAIARETLALLRSYPWPGNVRQLKQTLEQAISSAAGPLLMPGDLPGKVSEGRLTLAPWAGQDDVVSLDELERRHIMRVLAMTGGHTGDTAELLGIPRFALRRKLYGYGLSPVTIASFR